MNGSHGSRRSNAEPSHEELVRALLRWAGSAVIAMHHDDVTAGQQALLLMCSEHLLQAGNLLDAVFSGAGGSAPRKAPDLGRAASPATTPESSQEPPQRPSIGPRPPGPWLRDVAVPSVPSCARPGCGHHWSLHWIGVPPIDTPYQPLTPCHVDGCDCDCFAVAIVGK